MHFYTEYTILHNILSVIDAILISQFSLVEFKITYVYKYTARCNKYYKRKFLAIHLRNIQFCVLIPLDLFSNTQKNSKIGTNRTRKIVTRSYTQNSLRWILTPFL